MSALSEAAARQRAALDVAVLTLFVDIFEHVPLRVTGGRRALDSGMQRLLRYGWLEPCGSRGAHGRVPYRTTAAGRVRLAELTGAEQAVST